MNSCLYEFERPFFADSPFAGFLDPRNSLVRMFHYLRRPNRRTLAYTSPRHKLIQSIRLACPRQILDGDLCRPIIHPDAGCGRTCEDESEFGTSSFFSQRFDLIERSLAFSWSASLSQRSPNFCARPNYK